MTKTYNTPKRNHIVKTRLNDEEYEHFQRRLEVYGMNQSACVKTKRWKQKQTLWMNFKS